MFYKNVTSNEDSKGNVLFLILIAVALFAALSYAVTKSTSGGGNANTEKLSLKVSEILQYSTGLKTAIQRMRLTNNCSDEEISSHGSFWGHNKYRHTPEVRDECKIFHPDGGGVSYQAPSESWLDLSMSVNENQKTWALSAEMVDDVGLDTAGVGTDLLMHMCCVPKDLCLKINKELGVPEYSDNPPQEHDGIHLNYEFVGDYSYNGMLETGTRGRPFAGERIACIEEGFTPGKYSFYQVMIAR